MTTEKKARKKKKSEIATAEIDANVSRTREQDRAALRRKVENFYDLQRLRIQTAGRTYKRADGTEIQLHEVDVAILERRAAELEVSERHALRDVEEHLKTIKFYNDTLSDKVRFRGIGPTMAGVILSSFDIHREDTVSKMWAFAGLRPMPAMRCKSCHSVVEELPEVVEASEDRHYYRHLKERVRTATPPKPGETVEPKLPKCPYADKPVATTGVYESGKAQRPTKGEKLPYNAFLRTKLVGVLGPVMLKVGSPWKKVYDDYKHRKTTAGWGRSDAHRHQAAIRYMIKMLLLDIWKDWRVAEGLPVRPSYHEEKQGHVHNSLGKIVGVTQPLVSEAIDPEVAAELEQVERAS